MDFCTLFSGSSGNCTYLCDKSTKILIDVGMSMKAIMQALQCIGVSIEEISAILVTHEHIDHVKGLGPITRKYSTPVYANEKTAEFLIKQNGIASERLHIFENGKEFSHESFLFLPFKTPHDSVDSVGFRCSDENGKVAAVATDLGHLEDSMLSFLYGADVTLIEANHDENMVHQSSYPYSLKQRILSDFGHLSNDNSAVAIQYMIESGTQNVFLGHLSKENNYPLLAYQTVIQHLKNMGISESDLFLEVAPRSCPGTFLHI